MQQDRGEGSTPTKRRTVGSVIGGTLLNLAAVGGVVCIIAVIAAYAFNVTLIMFKTGSMSPTIPAGSLAVVRQIPASQVQVGDVVTVQRAGKLPISHRVTSISPAGGDARSMVLRGDANLANDPEPYTVSDVRIVMASAPGLAYGVMALSRPLVLGAITLGAAALVTWAFWPRAGGDKRRRKTAGHPHRSQTHRDIRRSKVSARGDMATTNTTTHMTTGRSLAVLPLIMAFVVGPPILARATETETVVHGRYLTLTSIGDTNAMSHLLPNRPVLWQVGVQAHPPETSVVHIGISAQGGLAGPGGLEVAVRACSVRWVNAACIAMESVWLTRRELATAVVPIDAYGAHQLGTMASTGQRWLLVEATLPPGTPRDATAQVQVHAWGTGDQINVGGTTAGDLATTGTPFARSITLALAAVLGGVALARLARCWRPPVGQLS